MCAQPIGACLVTKWPCRGAKSQFRATAGAAGTGSLHYKGRDQTQAAAAFVDPDGTAPAAPSCHLDALSPKGADQNHQFQRRSRCRLGGPCSHCLALLESHSVRRLALQLSREYFFTSAAQRQPKIQRTLERHDGCCGRSAAIRRDTQRKITLRGINHALLTKDACLARRT